MSGGITLYARLSQRCKRRLFRIDLDNNRWNLVLERRYTPHPMWEVPKPDIIGNVTIHADYYWTMYWRKERKYAR